MFSLLPLLANAYEACAVGCDVPLYTTAFEQLPATAEGCALSDSIVVKFSSGRPPLVGLEAINRALNPKGIRAWMLHVDEAAAALIEEVKDRGLAPVEKDKLMHLLHLDRSVLVADRMAAVSASGGAAPPLFFPDDAGHWTTTEGVSPPPCSDPNGEFCRTADPRDYPRVYDAAYPMTAHVQQLTSQGFKFAKLHVNAASNGTGVDEWKVLLRGQPTMWFFALDDGDVALLTYPYLRPGGRGPGLVLSFSAGSTPHGASTYAESMLFSAEGPVGTKTMGVPAGEEPGSRVSFSYAPGVRRWELRYTPEEAQWEPTAPYIFKKNCLGVNPWIDPKTDHVLIDGPSQFAKC